MSWPSTRRKQVRPSANYLSTAMVVLRPRSKIYNPGIGKIERSRLEPEMQNPTLSVEKGSLKAGTLAQLQSLLDLLKLNQHFAGDATVIGCDPLLRSPHRLAEATAYALLLEGIAAASIWKRRSGEDSSIGIELS